MVVCGYRWIVCSYHSWCIAFLLVCWKTFSTSSPLPQMSLLLQSESIFQSFPEDWHFYRDCKLLVFKNFLLFDWKNPPQLLLSSMKRTLPSFSNFQDLLNEIELLMKLFRIHQIFIRTVLFIVVSTLAYWSVKIHVTIHLPSGPTSKQTSTQLLLPLKSAFSLELAFI